MDSIDSPFEALAFHYVRFGLFTLVNNLWTFLAVVTAAVGFWRIKASESIPERFVEYGHPPREDTSSKANDQPSSIGDVMEEIVATSSSDDCKGEEDGVEGVTKGKFTTYFGDEGCNGEVAVDENEEEEEVRGGCGGGEWWEKVMKARNGEMGWYRYQDLGMLNGSVVRLWEESRKRSSYSSRCAVSVW